MYGATSHIQALLGGMYNPWKRISKYAQSAAEGVKRDKDEGYSSYINRVNNAIGSALDDVIGNPGPGSVRNTYGANIDRAIRNRESVGNDAMLGSMLGGDSFQRTPGWKAYSRGAIPTPSNYLATQPTYYHYSGGGPDPDKMLLFPGRPDMWDAQGWIAGGRNQSEARSLAEERKWRKSRRRIGRGW